MELIHLLTALCAAFVGIYTIGTIACSYVAVRQEQRIWSPDNMPSLSTFACAKVFLFNVLWIWMCTVGCLLVWIKWFATLGASDKAYECNRLVEPLSAKVCCMLIGHVQVVGAENLPPDDGSVPAPVYIANHASQVDISCVYQIQRRFKWIAKQTVLYVPGVGATMYTGEHVLINRATGKNTKSVNTLFDKSNAAVQSGIPMFLFPQGTRVMSERLPFKSGAFIIAQTNKSKLVPISIEIPMNAWETWYPFGNVVPEIKVTIHKPIQVTGEEDRDELKKQCSDLIYSCLPGIWKEQQSTTKEEDKKDK